MRDLAGRVAVVTGGGSGIGRGIALGLAAEEMTVAVADIRVESAEAVAAEINEGGGRAFAVAVDVTSVESLELAAKQVASEAGALHLLCANAGVLAQIAPLDDTTVEDWEYTLSVNVLGVVKTVQAFLPLLRKSAPDAHIVNTASLGGLISSPDLPIGAYTASKYACVGYSESLRAELAVEGIGVSVLCPSVVTSDLIATSTQNRPKGYGEQTTRSYDAPPDVADSHPASVPSMPAEEVGPIVVAGVRANRLHILTHPETRSRVEERFGSISDDYAFAAKNEAKP
ncbi:MAG: SDR family NAD(P)-dependent oxidoreductase [Deltaproteobacteria bacterium]|nr:SDR family NAD(P)-dependent oxidoreductase [Deltaproteobacteria bacterium]MBW2363124.1 SDR family NAD(P)-dependent oxidoreductase [Deltaproteobacteria bacterium]